MFVTVIIRLDLAFSTSDLNPPYFSLAFSYRKRGNRRWSKHIIEYTSFGY